MSSLQGLVHKAQFMEKLLDGAEVEWKTLGEVAEIGTGRHDTKDAIDDAEYVFYARGRAPLRLNVFDFDETAIITAGDGVGVGKVFHYAKGKYALHQRAYRIVPNEVMEPRFVYHYIAACFYTYIKKASVNSSVTSLRRPMFLKFPIPIPCPENPKKSLEIQAEIVRILDTFTELTTEITTELTTELTARKKQYNYYRDKLLTFKEGEVEWKTLGEVAMYSKTRISSDNIDKTNYVGVDNLLQNRVGKAESNYVPTEGNLTGYCNNDTLIGNIRPYLKKIWFADRIGGTNGDVLVIHPTDVAIDPRYLYQILADEKFFDYDMQHAKGAKMPRGNKDKIMEYPIPIPPLPMQTHIVAILDKFDALTNSITEGLPREIELRKKQYEYYRDLLLSFPKSLSHEGKPKGQQKKPPSSGEVPKGQQKKSPSFEEAPKGRQNKFPSNGGVPEGRGGLA